MHRSRFACPSASLPLKALLKQTRRVFCSGMGLAVAAHLALTQISGIGQEREIPRPLTTRFVKRQPRLSKPLEMKKRPQPRRRQVRREMVVVQAKIHRTRLAGVVRSVDVVQRLARPRAGVSRLVSFRGVDLESSQVAQTVRGSKEPEHTVHMSLEMMDVDALDTGRFQAMVIQDPTDKRGVKGFFHLYRAYSAEMQANTRHSDAYNIHGRVVRGLQRLISKLNAWTDVKADMRQPIPFDSQQLLWTPWVLVTCYTKFQVSRTDASNLGTYMTSGGFVFWDFGPEWWNCTHSARVAVDESFQAIGMSKGRDWDYQALPGAHPLYHCYYDMDDAPHGQVWSDPRSRDSGDPGYIQGVSIDRRLLMIFTNKFYVLVWSDWGVRHRVSLRCGMSELDPTRQFQFGINTIIFALTQEGSITERLMDAVQ